MLRLLGGSKAGEHRPGANKSAWSRVAAVTGIHAGNQMQSGRFDIPNEIIM